MNKARMELRDFKGEPAQIGVQILGSICTDQVKELSFEVAEIGIDAMLQDPLLQQIPIVGTLASVASGGFAVRDAIFLKKVLRFLSHLNSVPAQERSEFIRKCEA